jgi:hypothetical protein
MLKRLKPALRKQFKTPSVFAGNNSNLADIAAGALRIREAVPPPLDENYRQQYETL